MARNKVLIETVDFLSQTVKVKTINTIVFLFLFQIPPKYKCDDSLTRISWTEQMLQSALGAVQESGIGVNEAAGVPYTTLRRWRK